MENINESIYSSGKESICGVIYSNGTQLSNSQDVFDGYDSCIPNFDKILDNEDGYIKEDDIAVFQPDINKEIHTETKDETSLNFQFNILKNLTCPEYSESIGSMLPNLDQILDVCLYEVDTDSNNISPDKALNIKEEDSKSDGSDFNVHVNFVAKANCDIDNAPEEDIQDLNPVIFSLLEIKQNLQRSHFVEPEENFEGLAELFHEQVSQHQEKGTWSVLSHKFTFQIT